MGFFGACSTDVNATVCPWKNCKFDRNGAGCPLEKLDASKQLFIEADAPWHIPVKGNGDIAGLGVC